MMTAWTKVLKVEVVRQGLIENVFSGRSDSTC